MHIFYQLLTLLRLPPLPALHYPHPHRPHHHCLHLVIVGDDGDPPPETLIDWDDASPTESDETSLDWLFETPAVPAETGLEDPLSWLGAPPGPMRSPGNTTIVEHLQLRTDLLARLASQFSEKTRPIPVEDIDLVRVIGVDYHHVELEVMTCESEGCGLSRGHVAWEGLAKI